ncbi:nitronate monooxygenase family protein [Caulobacter sp. 17J65-9]|uniref:NAD(P)H-dependent flavin oxidoreductase n=1 Tax=Caulobacter sp. 17J65-9 TaxID=2709382 RepID=UPI0013CB2B7B|nr:nitronate monooxygenase family protein [Caulobacter sp. 17J65-9]NEX92451.1 nitronate monooxygenase [Caulobacter sp. 17J65-9]
MAIPAQLQRGLKLPVIAAPMFLVSGPELVIETCKAGVIGTFPALNHRTTEGYAAWLEQIKAALGPNDAAYGVNIIVHPTNPRVMADMQVTVEHKVPLVITSLGAVRDVVDAVHSYGGLVFHDVTNLRHAKKAAEAGVDGLILVAAGAGGHAGTWNPFALVNEIRSFFDGTIILSGCMSTGRDVAAAVMMGADFAYLGTRFINTTEAMAPDGFKDMIIQAGAADITYTPAISGIPANFLTQSLIANGLDPKSLPDKTKVDLGKELDHEVKAWKDVWSAGQGSGSIHDVLPTRELVTRLRREFDEAADQFARRFAAA